MRATLWPLRLLIVLLLATLAFSAQAAGRTFPAATERGRLVITDYPNVTISGKALRLSPGSRIWGPNNLTQIPNALGSDSYLVNYTLNIQGDVDRVWILTPDEAAQKVADQRSNLKL
ncbi:hypothetical protein [Paraherbaspirillum soli]|uniref:Uncharacterized protein n=1 Tax=Paraherbaspirillum soli TaxID=631222 RepID=A0ABW0M6Q4_9BURK